MWYLRPASSQQPTPSTTISVEPCWGGCWRTERERPWCSASAASIGRTPGGPELPRAGGLPVRLRSCSSRKWRAAGPGEEWSSAPLQGHNAPARPVAEQLEQLPALLGHSGMVWWQRCVPQQGREHLVRVVRVQHSGQEELPRRREGRQGTARALTPPAQRRPWGKGGKAARTWTACARARSVRTVAARRTTMWLVAPQRG